MRKKLLSAFLCVAMATTMLAGCGDKENPTTTSSGGSKSEKKIVVGFSQMGQESGWRDAETKSIQDYAKDHEDQYELKFSDGQQKQENQIQAIKDFIAQGVDVIGLAPKTETGWEQVFQEAKEANIPIVLLDRKADVDESLYTTFIGSDFIEEGQRAADELAKLINNKGNIVEIKGQDGASAAVERKKGFEDQLKAKYPDINILEAQTGEFDRAHGKTVMASFLQSYNNIDAVYAHNDDMMLGAIEAMKDAGKKPGKDIKTVSIDGVKGILEAMARGEANVTVECNPLLGELLFQTAEKLVNGDTVDRWIKQVDQVFTADQAEKILPSRKY